MKQKTITFRCSPAQLQRLEDMMKEAQIATRTEVIASALKEFLDFAERDEIRSMDLFTLVDFVDKHSKGPTFAEQAFGDSTPPPDAERTNSENSDNSEDSEQTH